MRLLITLALLGCPHSQVEINTYSQRCQLSAFGARSRLLKAFSDTVFDLSPSAKYIAF